MVEFESPERCAAYLATRGALAALQRASPDWPDELAARARAAALQAASTTVASLGHDPASAGRRRCLRHALHAAVDIAAACEVARALDARGADLDEAELAASRAISSLALFLHASLPPWTAE